MRSAFPKDVNGRFSDPIDPFRYALRDAGMVNGGDELSFVAGSDPRRTSATNGRVTAKARGCGQLVNLGGLFFDQNKMDELDF